MNRFTNALGLVLVLASGKVVAQNTFPATGNVGIGTTTPGDYLEANGNDVNKVALKVANSNGSPTGLEIMTAGSSGYGIPGWANSSVIESFSPNGLVLDSINWPGNNIGGPITFQINRSPVAVISTTGNVGIGTTAPNAKLEVNGNLQLTSGSGASITFQDGSTQNTAYTGVLCGGDYAESVDVSGDRTHYEPGDVLVIDAGAEGNFLKAAIPYSTSVTGIYSTKPGVVGRRQLTDRSHIKDEVPMAMTGIVPTKVSAENGAIKPGDLLVTSSKLGHAMKGTDRSQMLGAVIGKALGHLDSGTGVIEVVVTLQ